MIHFRSHDVGLTITGLAKAGETFFRASGVPHTCIPDYTLADAPQLASLHLTSGVPQFTADVERHEYVYAYDDAEPYQHILWMTGPILERCHQEANRFGIHAAAFAIQNKGVLIVGDTNSGKTSTLLTAVLARGHAAIAGERSLITDDAIIGGTRHITFFSGLVRSEPLLESLLQETEIGWKQEHRVRFRLADIGRVTSSAPLSVVVFATLTTASRLERIEWSPQKAVFELYKRMTEGIRAVGTFLFANTAGFPSLDSLALSRARMLAAKTIVANARVLVLRGDAVTLLDFIEQEALHVEHGSG